MSLPVATGWQARLGLGASRAQPLDAAITGLLLLGAVLFYITPWPLVYVPALLLVVWMAVQRPIIGLALVPLFAPFFMQPKHIGLEQFPPSELFLLATAIATVFSGARLWRDRSEFWQRLMRSGVLPPLALLLVAGAVSTTLAADRHHALEWFRWTILEPAVFAGLVAVLAIRREHWYLLFSAAVTAGFVVAVIGLVQFRTHQGLGSVPGTSIVRVRSVYGSPDNVGLLYDRLIPLLLPAALIPTLSRMQRTGVAAVGVVMLATLSLTGSRGAWAAVTVGCLFVLGVRFPWGRWVALAVVLVAVLLAALKGPAVAHAFQFGHQNTVSRRLDVWRSSLRMIRDHPWVGIGPDNFLHYYAPIKQLYIPCDHGLGYMEPSAAQEPCLSHPHNEVLDFYLSTGPLGLVAFAWLQVVFWRQAGRTWAHRMDGVRQGLLAGVMAAMLASLIHGMVDNSYFLVDLSVMFWLLMGYVTLYDPAGLDRPHKTVTRSHQL